MRSVGGDAAFHGCVGVGASLRRPCKEDPSGTEKYSEFGIVLCSLLGFSCASNEICPCPLACPISAASGSQAQGAVT